MITSKQISWLITIFLAIIVAVVFQQIYTSMTEQGIASGGPYDNGAAYPRAVAIIIGVLVLTQFLIERFGKKTNGPEDAGTPLNSLQRPFLLLVLFAIYLGLLNWLGYHLTTTPAIFIIMWLCGARQVMKLALVALAMSFVFAFIFEKFLNVVLPGGMFGLNIPW
jgi:putative tricarboxylic transport membrane protein